MTARKLLTIRPAVANRVLLAGSVFPIACAKAAGVASPTNETQAEQFIDSHFAPHRRAMTGGFLIGDDFVDGWPGVIQAAGEFSVRDIGARRCRGSTGTLSTPLE
jgi:hypothetical protein